MKWHFRTSASRAARAMGAPPPRFPFDRYRKLRFGRRPSCPRCGSSAVSKWGSFSGRRRYRCRDCTRTFSDFTGTPLSYIKKLDRWPLHCESALVDESLRREAALLGVHRNTTFRWRHRLLDGLRVVDSAALSGVIALRETPFHFSEKGSRKTRRPARRKRWPSGIHYFRAPAAWVTVALAQDGRVASAVCGGRRPTDGDYGRLLGGRLAEGARITSRHGELGAPALLARRLNLPHDKGSLRCKENDAASTYVSRLRGWIRRFHGVATKYLPNYLVWHRFLHTLGVTRCEVGMRHLLVVSFP